MSLTDFSYKYYVGTDTINVVLYAYGVMLVAVFIYGDAPNMGSIKDAFRASEPILTFALGMITGKNGTVLNTFTTTDMADCPACETGPEGCH